MFEKIKNLFKKPEVKSEPEPKKVKEKKVDYLEIDGNEMMKEDFNHFLEFLKSNGFEKSAVIAEVKKAREQKIKINSVDL